MIEWLERCDPKSLFLFAGDRIWTYAETLGEVQRRQSSEPRISAPALKPEDVFDVLAGISSGGVTVVGPEPETTEAFDDTLVVFTSGTSGQQKGVRLTMDNLSAAAEASIEHLGHGPEDNWLLAMPLHHVGGLSILIRQIFSGGSVTLRPGFEPESFAHAMKERVTMVSVVPTMLTRLLDRAPFSGLRAVLVGGGPIPNGLLEKAVEAGLPVLPTYGMTETFGQVATLRPDAALKYVTHALPGVDLKIVDSRIAIRSRQLFKGYVGQPERDSEWFVTNDLGELDDDGALTVLGRADTVIITGGENVSPERVEAALAPWVDRSVVVGVPDERWGQLVACVYEGERTTDELRSLVESQLPAHMVPKLFKRVEKVPTTTLGKPDRLAALELL